MATKFTVTAVGLTLTTKIACQEGEEKGYTTAEAIFEMLTNSEMVWSASQAFTGSINFQGNVTFDGLPQCQAESTTSGYDLLSRELGDARWMRLSTNQVVSGVKTFASVPKSTGSLSGDATELPNVGQVQGILNARDVVPLIDWQFSGWAGSGAIPSRGAAGNDLMVTGASGSEGASGAGVQLAFDGVDDYAKAASKDFWNRVHVGGDFTLVIEGEQCAVAAGTRPVISTRAIGSGVGFAILGSGGLGGRLIFDYSPGSQYWLESLGDGAVITRIVLTRAGDSWTMRATVSGVDHGMSWTEALTDGNASTTELEISRQPTHNNMFNPLRLSRIRLFDRAVNL